MNYEQTLSRFAPRHPFHGHDVHCAGRFAACCQLRLFHEEQHHALRRIILRSCRCGRIRVFTEKGISRLTTYPFSSYTLYNIGIILHLAR